MKRIWPVWFKKFADNVCRSSWLWTRHWMGLWRRPTSWAFVTSRSSRSTMAAPSNSSSTASCKRRKCNHDPIYIKPSGTSVCLCDSFERQQLAILLESPLFYLFPLPPQPHRSLSPPASVNNLSCMLFEIRISSFCPTRWLTGLVLGSNFWHKFSLIWSTRSLRSALSLSVWELCKFLHMETNSLFCVV